MIISNVAHRLAWQRFIYATGATDKSNLLAWCDGIYELGLWPNMVCWPMVAGQSIGSGTSVPSLGGLGSYPGTMAAGPTWGADGSGFDGTDDLIQTDLINDSVFTMFAVFNCTGGSTAQCVIGSNGFSGAGGTQQLFTAHNTDEGAVCYAGQNALHGSLLAGNHMLACEWDDIANTVKSSRNGGSTLSSGWSGGFSASAKTIGAVTGVGDAGPNYFTGTISIAGVISGAAITSSESLYSLYKSTLGIGLNLPA